MRYVVLVLSLLLFGCSGSEGEAATTTGVFDNLGACPTEAGEVITESMVASGCLRGNRVVMLGVHDCDDGRQLWSEGELWGWVGEPLQKSDEDAASDPEYAEAYEQCFDQ